VLISQSDTPRQIPSLAENRFTLFSGLSVAVPLLRRLVAGLSPRRPGLFRVGFVVDKVAPDRFLSEFFGFPPASYHSTTAPYPSVTGP
jgi:hypothetical protein